MLVPGRRAGQPDTTLRATVKLLDAGVGPAFFAGLVKTAADRLRRTGESALPVPADDLAPEQAIDPAHSDIRADIYALGCILYHGVAGQPPFPGAGSLVQVLRHATEAPPPLRDFAAALPAGLQEVVDRLLAKDPAGRYPTPEAAARALRPFLP
jgi:serine/threonine protein kinase